MPTHNILVSSARNASDSNSRLLMRLPVPHIVQPKERIGLASLTMPYSWFNMTSSFNNLTCSYKWVDDTVHTVTFPAGSYTVDDISSFIQLTMYNNGHYLLNADGEAIYYMNLVVNDVYYAVTLTCTVLPSSLPSGYSLPSGASWTCNGKTPILTTSSNNFGKLIGFAASTSFPSVAASSTQQFNSSVAPVISPVVSVNVGCSWVYDYQFNSHPSIIYNFVPNVGIGQNITKETPFLCMYDVAGNHYYDIEISFYDQEFRNLELVDTNQIQVSLILESDK